MKPIIVLLAEDHAVVRESFRAMLEMEADLEVVAEARNGRAAIALTLKLRPEVVLMDIAMPLLNGLEATRQLIGAWPEARVLMLSAHSDDAYVQRSMEVGARGFLLKQASSHVVCDAIREVHHGRRYFCPAVTKRLRDMKAQVVSAGKAVKTSGLTAREMEVLQLIAEGKANKETATELGIGVKTVEKHREHLMQKLAIHDTAGLTRYAIGIGIVESHRQIAVR